MTTNVTKIPPPPYTDDFGESWLQWFATIYPFLSSTDLTLLARADAASGDEYVTFTNIFDDSLYDHYIIHFSDVHSTDDAKHHLIQIGTGTDPTWITATYTNGYFGVTGSSSSVGGGNMTGEFGVLHNESVSNLDDERANGEIRIVDVENTTDQFLVRVDAWGKNSTPAVWAQQVVVGLTDAPSAAITSARFTFGTSAGAHSSETYVSGSYRVYGFRDRN